MPKNTLNNHRPPVAAPKPTTTFAYRPKKIGPLLEQRVRAMQLDLDEVAAFIGVKRHAIYKKFKVVEVSMDELMRWSELFGENLLLLYHPNVPPPPNPLQAEFDRVKGYLKQLEGTEEKNDKLLMENKSLRDQVALQQATIVKMNGR